MPQKKKKLGFSVFFFFPQPWEITQSLGRLSQTFWPRNTRGPPSWTGGLFECRPPPWQKLAKFHQIAANLRDNADLRRAVLSGRTTPQQLVHMHAWELGVPMARDGGCSLGVIPVRPSQCLFSSQDDGSAPFLFLFSNIECNIWCLWFPPKLPSPVFDTDMACP